MRKSLNLIESKNQKELYEEAVRKKCEAAFSNEHCPVTLARTLDLLQGLNFCGKKIADIGCGKGELALALAAKGAQLTAVDASSKSLAAFDHPNIVKKQDYLPYLPYSDSSFDGVICCDVLAELESHLHRLALSELSRMTHREGWVVLSTSLDVHSLDAGGAFLELIQTEFEVREISCSYHRLWNCVEKILPKKWHHRQLLLATERIAKVIWDRAAETHIIVLAGKKKMRYND